MEISRRNLLKSSVVAGLSFELDQHTLLTHKKKHQFSFSLNTSTIREQKLGLMGELEVAAKAGYNSIEIWMNTLQDFLAKGGTLKDVKKKADDLGLKIIDCIGFHKWIVDDATERKAALEQAKRELDILAQIGCKYVAAPPFGAHNIESKINLNAVTERYAALLKVGDETGVIPQLEMWGFSKNLHLMGEVMYVAAETGHKNACILSDVYHLHKGGSQNSSLQMVAGQGLHVFHVNDYPGTPTKENIKDADRVFPGDGVAPLNQIFKDLHQKNVPITLSLELFNENYWKMDALAAAKEGLTKMKAAVQKAIV